MTVHTPQVEWVLARERLPTKENADLNGNVFWCGVEQVRLTKVSEILSWNFEFEEDAVLPQDWKHVGCWAETGLPKSIKYPAPPDLERRQTNTGMIRGYYVGVAESYNEACAAVLKSKADGQPFATINDLVVALNVSGPITRAIYDGYWFGETCVVLHTNAEMHRFQSEENQLFEQLVDTRVLRNCGDQSETVQLRT